MTTIEPRDATRADWAQLLALNLASVEALSPLDEDRLEFILSLTHRSLVVDCNGEVVAFALALAPGTAYDSRNYRWFGDRLERFLYLDRVVVAEPFRRRGFGARIYDAMEAAAVPFDRMVCDVNVRPPNHGSLAFHAARGYREIGRLTHPGKVVALMSKELAPDRRGGPAGPQAL
jgi:predicted GNAT superfamily acetyltransferase